MLTENEVKNQIAIGKTKAKQMEYWDGEGPLLYHDGYIHALEWVIGKYKPEYNKEDI